MTAVDERNVVFNIVWTGTVFPYLRYFVASQLAHSDARFRFVGNGCPPEQLSLMEAFAERQGGRVVEVLDVSPDAMLRHGDALDAVLRQRDDGEYFCFIDPDICASGPFVADFTARLGPSCAGVTSGRGVWCDTDVVPEGHPGVNGEYFYSRDGYVFGSPHFALYRRAPLVETLHRWRIGFGSAGGELDDDAKAVLARAGLDYWIYDTGKLVNVFLQESGHGFAHTEHPNLLHVGGMSHYLSPPGYVQGTEGDEEPEPDWSRWRGMAERFEVARFSASVLKAAMRGEPAPAVPDGLEPSMAAKLRLVSDRLVDLVATYGGEASP